MKTLLPYLHKLDHEFPKEVRLEVYKKAIEIIEKNLHATKEIKSYQLCLLIPVICWEIKHYLSRPLISGVLCDWDYNDTNIAFPEINDEFIGEIVKMPTWQRMDFRIEYLNKWVAQLEKEIK